MGSGRGATREVIERNTFPHKYKRIRRSSATDDDEKCTICLSQFEIEHEVRYESLLAFFLKFKFLIVVFLILDVFHACICFTQTVLISGLSPISIVQSVGLTLRLI